MATIKTSFFIRGLTGHGYQGTSGFQVCNSMPKQAPDRKPDFVNEEKTNPNQAFLYRLCSDKNPLHVDPDKSGGFERPILHGLCSFGFTGRTLWQNMFLEDAMRLREMGARFTSHVFPGETLVVRAW